MANSKRKRPSTPRRPADDGRHRAASSVRPAPASPGGPNRLQRKEEARRERETVQRRAARRRTLRRTAWITGGVAIVAAVALVLFNTSSGASLNKDQQQLLAAAPAAAQAAGCSTVQTVKPYSPENLDRAHIGTTGAPTTMPALTTYPSQPPTSGPHNPTPLAAGVYQDAPALDEAIHSLEHAAAIVWYAPSAGGSAEMVKIEQFFAEAANRDHVIVAPYDYPQAGGQLPTGKQMVLVAWHHMETCAAPSLAAAYQFVHSYRVTTACDTTSYKGDAPEPCASM